MDINTAIRNRHSVRSYLDKKIEPEKRRVLDHMAMEVSRISGLDFWVVYDDPEGFDSSLAKYGKFKNVQNYIVISGPRKENLDERAGYYGERLVIAAQRMGLNTCWVGMTFNKRAVKKLVPAGNKLIIVIALGYGETQGVFRASKPIEEVVATKGNMPEWFRKGAEAALLAPTAINQQKFKMGMKDGRPVITASARGFYVKVDLGIVKYHFEIASGHKVRVE